MTTKSSQSDKILYRLRLTELFLYAGTATLAIGQVFYATGPVSLISATLVLVGILIASLAIFSITPATMLLARMKITLSDSVLHFHNKSPETTIRVIDNNRRAA